MFHTLNIALFSTTHSTHTIITMQDVCLDMGHLRCATILYSYPLFPVGGVHSFQTAVPHKRGEGRGAKQPLEWGHRCPSSPYHAVLNSTSWVIVNLSQSSEHPTTLCWVSRGASPWIPVCICVCDQNNLLLGCLIEVSLGESDSI